MEKLVEIEFHLNTVKERIDDAISSFDANRYCDMISEVYYLRKHLDILDSLINKEELKKLESESK